MLKKDVTTGAVAQLVVAHDQHLGELVRDQQDERQTQPGQHATTRATNQPGLAFRGHQAIVRTSPAPNRLLVHRQQIVGCAGSWPMSSR
jgi:hypothetical protein